MFVVRRRSSWPWKGPRGPTENLQKAFWALMSFLKVFCRSLGGALGGPWGAGGAHPGALIGRCFSLRNWLVVTERNGDLPKALFLHL